MTAIVQASDYADLVTQTLDDLGPGKWTDLTSSLQDHPAAKRLLRKHKTTYGSGKALSFNLMVAVEATTSVVAMNAPDNYHFADVMDTGTVPWRFMNSHMTILKQAIDMNMGTAEITNMVKTRRAATMAGKIEKYEEYFWSKPTDSTDVLSLYGLYYWVTKTGLTSTFGFNGTLPSGFSDVAGIDPTVYPKWANGGRTYDDATQADLVEGLWECMDKCNFKPPVDMPTYSNDANGKSIFTNWTGRQVLKRVLMGNNDNLGYDLDPVGNPMLRRQPIEWVPYLDSDTTNPYYGIDWSTFGIKAHKKWWEKQTGPRDCPGARNSVVTDWDTICNFMCTNRRHNWVMYEV